RNSIQCMPNSRDATSQAWPKSCEISSLMTETRKGELESEGGRNRDAAFAAVTATIPARNSRRANSMDMRLLLNSRGHGNDGRRQNKSITIRKMGGSRGPSRRWLETTGNSRGTV